MTDRQPVAIAQNGTSSTNPNAGCGGAEQFGALATAGHHVYDISGRCGVFAKTDIQPLLNQCVAKEDIALSVFHAIAKQTIGGLVQGMEIRPPVIFEGGPLFFNPRLIEVFAERLALSGDDVIVPSRPEIIVAHGTALAVGCMFNDRPSTYDRSQLPLLGRTDISIVKTGFHDDRFFENDAERALEQYTGRTVVRPPHPGEMGAIGIALLAKKASAAAELIHGLIDGFWFWKGRRRVVEVDDVTHVEIPRAVRPDRMV